MSFFTDAVVVAEVCVLALAHMPPGPIVRIKPPLDNTLYAWIEAGTRTPEDEEWRRGAGLAADDGDA